MLRPKHLPVFLLVFVLLFCAAGSWAQQSIPVASTNQTQFWLVELTSPPVADGGDAAQLKKDKTNFRAAAAQAKISYVERKAYDILFNGFAIKATRTAVATMSTLPGVKAVYPDSIITLDPRAGTAEPDLFWATQMTGASQVQDELGFTGKGVKVGVIDTGIDYKHPDLGGCNSGIGNACRVAGGYDLVGDAYDANTNPNPVPDNDPMDCAGHGSHVSGIIGANGDPATGGVKGVAPGVTFYAYRVFGCAGSTQDSVMIEAMERALNDGVQVVNMSIGAAFGWPQWPTAMASDRLVRNGVVVVASIGNSGANGLYSAGAPGLGKDVIGVASFDNSHVYEQYFTASGDNAKFGFLPATGAPPPPTSGTFPVTAIGTPTITNAGCAALPAGSLAGQVALIRRGTCGFNVKAINAQAAGAAGVILYNNATGFLNATVAGPPAPTIPVVAVTAADGAALFARASSGLNITFTPNFDYFVDPFNGGLISSFSSYGLSPDLTFKPDIGAPGGNIRSTYPLALGGYAVLSGTSMSSPHVAGTVALLLEAEPKLKPHSVRDILQNTALPRDWWGFPGVGLRESTFRQGAGMVNIYDAITTTARVTPAKLALGESESGPVTTTLTLSNDSNQPVSYDVSYESAIATSGTFTQSFWLTDETVTFSANSVTVPAGGSANVNATISTPTLDPLGAIGVPQDTLYGGWIVFTPTSGDGLTLRVPYGGLVGNYQALRALTSGGSGFPLLAKIVGPNYVPQLAGAVYTMAGVDIPIILVHINQQFQLLQMQLFDAATGKSYQFIDNEKYLPRNSTATGFFAFAFDGTTFLANGKKQFVVPNGNYVITIRALKALGDENNPADTETWTSPNFTIARP